MGTRLLTPIKTMISMCQLVLVVPHPTYTKTSTIFASTTGVARQTRNKVALPPVNLPALFPNGGSIKVAGLNQLLSLGYQRLHLLTMQGQVRL